MEGNNKIKEILIKEDLMDTDNSTINLCFRGKDNSGIIEMTHKEAEELTSMLDSKLNLVKKSRIIKG